MPRIYVKKGEEARSSHLSVLLTKELHERCRATARLAGFDSLSMWASMILARAVQSRESGDNQERAA